MSEPKPDHEALDFAAKNAWREKEGWASAEEAWITLSGSDGARCELIEEEDEPQS